MARASNGAAWTPICAAASRHSDKRGAIDEREMSRVCARSLCRASTLDATSCRAPASRPKRRRSSVTPDSALTTTTGSRCTNPSTMAAALRKAPGRPHSSAAELRTIMNACTPSLMWHRGRRRAEKVQAGFISQEPAGSSGRTSYGVRDHSGKIPVQAAIRQLKFYGRTARSPARSSQRNRALGSRTHPAPAAPGRSVQGPVRRRLLRPSRVCMRRQRRPGRRVGGADAGGPSTPGRASRPAIRHRARGALGSVLSWVGTLDEHHLRSSGWCRGRDSNPHGGLASGDPRSSARHPAASSPVQEHLVT